MTARKWQPQGLRAPRFPDLPDELTRVVLHALGIHGSYAGKCKVGGWRNYYSGDSEGKCKRLVGLGWMVCIRESSPGWDDCVYSVSHAGITALKALGWVIKERA